MLTPQMQAQIDQEAKSSAANFNYYPESNECEDLESAYVTGATKYASLWQEAEQRAERYEKALKDIASGKALPQLIAQLALKVKTTNDGNDK